MKIIVLLCLLLFARLNAELFSSMAGLEAIGRSSTLITDILNDYIEAEEGRIEQLKSYIAARRAGRSNMQISYSSHSNCSYEESVCSTNPVSIYRQMRRLMQDNAPIFKLMQKNIAEDYLNKLYRVMPPFGEKDIAGAVAAIGRLMDAYKLNASDIASGKLLQIGAHESLSADDCFVMAAQFFSAGDYYHCLPWLLVTEQLVNDPETVPDLYRSFNQTILYDYLAYSSYAQGNLEHAVHYSRLLNSIDPAYPTAEYLPIYENLLEESKSTWNGSVETLPEVRFHRQILPYENYEELCRGESSLASEEEAKLNCFMKTNHPYLRIAPLKVEVVYNDPRIIVVRHALSDNESERLKNLASPRLRRALVVNRNRTSIADEHVAADFRVAQNMWLDDDLDSVVRQVNQRIKMMTDLDQTHSEMLQIANYGLGGHYEPHYDMAVDGEHMALNDESHGNRIATLLFYLSDVLYGGSTVFTKLGIGVRPSKNDAVFWYNVHRNGSADMRTEHAACPVLLGVKWVANRWMHERGQEVTRPCSLNKNE